MKHNRIGQYAEATERLECIITNMPMLVFVSNKSLDLKVFSIYSYISLLKLHSFH